MNVRRHAILLAVTVLLIAGWFTATLLGDDRPVLGLDLQGGISIVLFPEKGQDLSALDTAADIIRNRVDALGIAEPEISRQGNTIVIDLPGVKERAQAEALVGQTAELRFRLVQNILPWDQPVPTTTTTVAGSTTTLAPGATTVDPGATTTTSAGAPSTTVAGDAAGVAVTVEPIASVRPAQETATTATPTTAVADTSTTAVTPGESTTTTTAPVVPEAGSVCSDLVTPRDEQTAEGTVWLPGPDDNDDGTPDQCYLLGPTLLTGRNIEGAEGVYNQSASAYVVDVTFKTDEFVTKVAQPYVNQFVAIELDGVVVSAPQINPGITGRNVQISGDFSKGDAKDLALVLRYGSLPIRFDESEKTVRSVSPTLGKDQLRAGIVAGLIGLGLVMLYMIVYYRLLGLVVWVGLGLTALLFFALVSWLSATRGLTLTLAGVTGLIVSVGVTVDSYVVYFERLKDEVRMGKTIRSSLDSGFRRAFRTIVAADLVSLLGAAVLYVLAEGSVRGFAFFLLLSTLIDLGIAYFVMHPLVSLMARRPALVRMHKVGIASGLDVAGVRA